MEKIHRLTFNRVILDIPDILAKPDGTVSDIAIPLIHFLMNTARWIPLEIGVLVPRKQYFAELDNNPKGKTLVDKLFFDQAGIERLVTIFIDSDSLKELKHTLKMPENRNSIVITNNSKYKRLRNVVYLEGVVKNKKNESKDLISHLKQIFYSCPRSLVRKAKNNDSESMTVVLARVKLYLSGLISSLYQRYNSPSLPISSKDRKDTIDQIVNEKILEAIARWNEKKVPIERFAYLMVKQAFNPSSYKSFRAKALDELLLCPPDKRIDPSFAACLLPVTNIEEPIFTEDIRKVINKQLTPYEAKVLNLYFGLNGQATHTFEEIAELLKTKNNFFLTADKINHTYRKAIKKLKNCTALKDLLISKNLLSKGESHDSK